MDEEVDAQVDAELSSRMSKPPKDATTGSESKPEGGKLEGANFPRSTSCRVPTSTLLQRSLQQRIPHR